MKPRILAEPVWARWGWIVDSVAGRHGVTRDELLSRRRTSEIAAARHDLMSCLWGSGLGYSAIGRLLGLDHTTIIAGVKKAVA